MKIIFLDIDGVLNVIGQGHDQYGQIFHKEFVENLRYIIEQTNAKIVLSSTWRFKGIDVIKQMWIDRNLPGEVIDITIDSFDLIEEGLFSDFDEVKRGNEIQRWIDDNIYNIESYVIIDDDTDMLPNQINRFVQTSCNINHIDCVDIGYGLTKICANKAIRILEWNL